MGDLSFGWIFYIAVAPRLQVGNGKIMWVCLSAVRQYVIEACMPWEMCTGGLNIFHDKNMISSPPAVFITIDIQISIANTKLRSSTTDVDGFAFQTSGNVKWIKQFLPCDLIGI